MSSNLLNEDIWTLYDKFKSNSLDKEDKKEENLELICKECNSNEILLDDGNYVCQKCYMIVNRFIDDSAEWRNFNSEDNKSTDMNRCCMPNNEFIPNASLGSVVGFSNEKEDYQIHKMRKYHLWNSMNYPDRTMFNVFDYLTSMASSHGMNKMIIDDAKKLYKDFTENKIGRGDSRHSIIASSLYMSCKKNNVPRSTKEIANIFNLEESAVTKSCKKFQECMNLKIKSSNASDFVSRFCSKLNIDRHIQDFCKKIIKRITDLGIASDNTPPSLAASVIYFSSMILNYHIDKKMISYSCEISQITINKCYKKLDMYKSYFLDDNEIKEIKYYQ